GLRVESEVTVGDPESSVVVRLPVEAPPGRNSCTRPFTCTESPGLTAGVDDVKTKAPSDVSTFASQSAWAASSQKPFVDFAVTIPLVDTTCPLYGETCVAPWIAWIATNGPSTESAIEAKVERACASATVHWSDLLPGTVPAATVALYENVFAGLSANACVAEPPIADRSQVTVIAVLGGFVPGVTVTVSCVEPPTGTVAG